MQPSNDRRGRAASGRSAAKRGLYNTRFPEALDTVQKLLHTARFHTTVARFAQLPRGLLPEVAFVGRSNAGKSSAINALCQRKRLAFASKSPGRTQALNFFGLGPVDADPIGFLVDTPGYGYATAPGDVKAQWDGLAGEYLQRGAENLRGVVLLVDIRRQITPRDRILLEYLPPETPLLVLITKADKLGRAGQWESREAIRRQLAELDIAPERAELVLFSSPERTGLAQAAARISAWIVGPVDALENGDRKPALHESSTTMNDQPETDTPEP